MLCFYVVLCVFVSVCCLQDLSRYILGSNNQDGTGRECFDVFGAGKTKTGRDGNIMKGSVLTCLAGGKNEDGTGR